MKSDKSSKSNKTSKTCSNEQSDKADKADKAAKQPKSWCASYDNPILINRSQHIVRSDYELLWDMLRDNAQTTNDGISIKEVALKHSNISYEKAKAWLSNLVKASYVECVANERLNSACQSYLYKLKKDCGQTPPQVDKYGNIKPKSGNDLSWLCMRIMKRFTAGQLVASASTPTLMLKTTSVKQYIKKLHRAGYLEVIKGGKSRIPATYYLRHDTGSKAPKVKRGDVVFDQNMQAIVYDPKTPLPPSHQTVHQTTGGVR